MAKPYKTSLPYRTYVRNLVANLREYFFLHDWTIRIEYPDTDPDGAMAGAVAVIYNDSTYLNATMELFPRMKGIFEEDPIEDFVQLVLHEIVHIPTDAVWKLAKTATSEITEPHARFLLEQQTQRLTRIIFQSLPKSVYQF